LELKSIEIKYSAPTEEVGADQGKPGILLLLLYYIDFLQID